jgi:hypothetical protein
VNFQSRTFKGHIKEDKDQNDKLINDFTFARSSKAREPNKSTIEEASICSPLVS